MSAFQRFCALAFSLRLAARHLSKGWSCAILLVCALSGPAAAVSIRSDFDHDCDVDGHDFAIFQSCASGPSIAYGGDCAKADFDFDSDVDLDDFGIFQRCYSGEGRPADPNCDPPCSGPDCACLCGQTNCNGTCTVTASDNANCGACGNVCAAGTTCQGGFCAPPCDPCDIFAWCYCGPDHPYYPSCGCICGSPFCGGVCTDTATDNANCGTCGNVCPAGTACVNGACTASCSGFCEGFCDGMCVNVCSDAANCGVCGNQCQADELCVFGGCQGTCSGCQ